MKTTNTHFTGNPYESPATPDAPSPTSSASTQGKGVRAPLLVGCAGFASLGSSVWFSCMCGHISPIALVFTVPAAVVSWLTLSTVRSRGTLFAIMTVLVAVFTTLVLVKNLADTLWYGHEAIWPVLQTRQSEMRARQSGDWFSLAIFPGLFSILGVGCLRLVVCVVGRTTKQNGD